MCNSYSKNTPVDLKKGHYKSMKVKNSRSRKNHHNNNIFFKLL